MFSVGGYVLQLMKIKNPVFQNIRIIHKTNEKRIYNTKLSTFRKIQSLMHSILSQGCVCTNYCINAA